MDMEAYGKSLWESGAGEKLLGLAGSEAGAKLAAQVDGRAVQEAAQRGDSRELADLLKNILSTAEGRAFAEQVRKAVDSHGR